MRVYCMYMYCDICMYVCGGRHLTAAYTFSAFNSTSGGGGGGWGVGGSLGTRLMAVPVGSPD